MPNKILIVDDEPFNLDLLEQELMDQGYVIERANDGAEALKKIDSTQPDLVLLDYNMPDLNGIEVLKELRKKECDVPVIMLTAHGTIERAVTAIKEGAYDFLTKPFEPDHITFTVKKALEQERLKRRVEILSEEIGQGYRLIEGKSTKMNPLLPLTALVSPRNFWKASFSDMKRGPLPGPISSKKERWSWPMAGRSSWTRWAISHRSFNPSSSGFSRSGHLSGWEEPNRSVWM
jgi:DNA-binding NtrC family response regulator